MKCACLENFQKKILSPKMCVEIVLTIFKVYKSALLLLLKRQCLILLKKYIYSLLYAGNVRVLKIFRKNSKCQNVC